MSEAKVHPGNIRKKTHRRKTFWQVWFPLILSMMILVTIAVFVVLLTFNPNFGDFHTKWSSISLVFLSIPVLITALIVAVVIIAMIYLIGRLYVILPDYSQKLLEFLQMISSYAKLGSDRIASPIIYISSKLSGLRSIYKKNEKP